MTPKLSGPMVDVLRNLERGDDAGAHCRGRSEFGGLTRTIRALCSREFVRYETPSMDLVITDAGRRALQEWRKGT